MTTVEKIGDMMVYTFTRYAADALENAWKAMELVGRFEEAERIKPMLEETRSMAEAFKTYIRRNDAR